MQHKVADEIHILVPSVERPDEKEVIDHFVCIHQ
jgi:hypothetical protein